MPRSHQRRPVFSVSLSRTLGLGLSIVLLTQAGVCSSLTPDARASQANQLLLPGATIERELAGGETHTYIVALAAGEFVRLVVEQRGIDVVLALAAPDGKPLAVVDSPIGFANEKRLSFVADVAGNHQLTVRPSGKETARGAYLLKAEEWRHAEQKDANLAASERTFAEAEQLNKQSNAEATRRAIEKYGEALDLWRAAEDRLAEAFTLLRMGLANHNLSRLKQAIDCYNQALPIFQEMGDERGVAQALTALGWSYQGLGQPQKALDHLNRSLEIRRSLQEPRAIAQTLNLVADALSSLDEPGQAIDSYLEALPLAQAAGDQAIEAYALNGLGWLYHQSGQYVKALDFINRALPIWRKLGNRYGEAHALNVRGTIYSIWLYVAESLESYHESSRIWREVGNRYGEAQALNNIGVLYYQLADNERARDFCLQAIAIWQAIGNRNEEAKTLNNLGLISSNLGKQEEALEYFSQALPLYRAAGDRTGQAASLHNIGRTRWFMSDAQQSLNYFGQALKLNQETGNRIAEARLLHDLGFVYERLGDEQRAFDYYNQALPHLTVSALVGLARIELKRGNFSAARAHSEAVIKRLENRRARIPEQELRVFYAASIRDRYELHANILMRLHERAAASGQPSGEYLTAAFLTSERARARGLLETLVEARADIRQGVEPALLAEERSLQDQLNARETRRLELLSSRGQEKRLAALENEIEALQRQLQNVQAQIRARSPKYAALTQPVPLSLAEVQRLLDDDTILLEFLLGQDRSFLWVVTSSSVNGHVLPPRAEIETHARRMYELMTAPGQTAPGESSEPALATGTVEYEEVAATLSSMLLGPAAGQLGKKRLLIVSDGVLEYLPLGALPVPETQRHSDTETQRQNPDRRAPASPRPRVEFVPLIADHEIVNLPSASVLAVLRRELAARQPAPKTLAVLADPVFRADDSRVVASTTANDKVLLASSPSTTKPLRPGPDLERPARDTGLSDFVRLRFSRQEADLITAFVPEKDRLRALDFAASREMAQSTELGKYRILHFATHGLLNSKHPELSGLVLSLVNEQGQPQDGFLRFHEIYNLKLNADLVVLSACQTALGKEVRGEGLIGLTRGFMYAGAPRVVASLWRVDDRATAELMKRFYQSMLKDGLRPAAALRAAQVALLREKRWSAPHYWAAFTLQGEWR
ncbi:MAG TPA: CHAT domain-containing protein [Blastocatellia bacterium]|nr:CHAT domain-containing protein [Blastocatellia bacterium]